MQQKTTMKNENTQQQVTRARAVLRSHRVNSPATRRQSGTSTQEFMLWGLLAALVLIGALIAYVRNDATSQGQALVTDFNAMSAKSSTLYSGNWANFTTVNADNAGLFKNYTAFIDNGGGSIITKPGNGTITVAGGQLANANDAGQYTITQLGEDACSTFVAGVQRSAGKVTVNGTSVKDYGGTFKPDQMQCKDSDNTIIVTRA